MKSRPLIIGSAWILSLAGAYIIGSGGTESTDPTTNSGSRQSTPAKSVRPGSGSADLASDRRALSASPAIRAAGSLPARQAVAELALLTDPIDRVQGFLALVDSLGPDEFEGVVAEFRSLGITQERLTEYGILLHAWGQSNPPAALDYALENTGTNFARQTVLASWATYDPDAAIAAAEAQFEGDGANPMLVGVIRGLAREDLNRATDLMQGLPRSRERGDALETLLPIILADGVDSALTWSDGITDEGLRGATVASIARHVSDEDPAKAADMIMSIEDDDSKFRALDDIAESWAKQDIDAAVAFANTLEPTLKAEAAEGIIRELASENPLEASQWMETLAAEGVNLDAAIHRFIWKANSTQPELAANWIGQMTDKRDAERNYHHFLGRWQSQDAEAANAWIANTELPKSIKRRFAPKTDQQR